MKRFESKTLLAVLGCVFLAACGDGEPTAADIGDETGIVEELDNPADAGGEETATGEDEVVEETVIEESVVEETAVDAAEETGDRILLAQAETGPGSATNYQYEEGKHYARLVPTQPTVGGADKIEVAEFFWYGCPHCFDLEPTINAWAEDAPPTVRFVRVPAMWNQVLRTHAQVFYTLDVLAQNDALEQPEQLHGAIFEEYHRRGNRLMSEDAIARLFERFGVSKDAFSKAWGSFEVAQKMRVAEDLARRYSISSVPTIVVNGKYRTGAAEAGSYPKLIEVIDELVDRESAR